jgi:hypothetical protein
MAKYYFSKIIRFSHLTPLSMCSPIRVKFVPSFFIKSSPIGGKLAHVEIFDAFVLLYLHRGEHIVLFRKMEGRTEDLHPKWTKFTPGVKTRPMGEIKTQPLTCCCCCCCCDSDEVSLSSDESSSTSLANAETIALTSENDYVITHVLK